MYYSTNPTPSFNKKDIENQEKTRSGFLFEGVNMKPVEDPRITVADTKTADEHAIVKEPSK